MNKSGYWSPYVAGAGLGLTLLASFVLAGQGLGASRAFTVVAGTAMKGVAPEYTSTLTYLSNYLALTPLQDWTVVLVIGVFIGGIIGALLSGGFKLQIDKGASMSNGMRLVAAFGGGTVLGFAARLARGCTSGVGLTGCSQFALSGWIFILAMFASGFLFAALFRRLWS